MKNEQEIVRSVFDAYIRDAKATSTKKDRPTFDMLEKVKNRAIKALEQQPTSEDCISRQETLDAIIKELGIRNESYLMECERPIYNVVKNMPPVTPTHGSCKDCKQGQKDDHGVYCTNLGGTNKESWYCADFEKRGNENE